MKKRVKIFVLLIFVLLGGGMILVHPDVSAKPAFMDRYSSDPYSKPAMRGKCTVCHIGHGGGERNDFGEAFEDAGYRLTPKLRAKFPELFEKRPNADTALR
jgi:hypothetical protein